MVRMCYYNSKNNRGLTKWEKLVFAVQWVGKRGYNIRTGIIK